MDGPPGSVSKSLLPWLAAGQQLGVISAQATLAFSLGLSLASA